jgi:DNA-binding GntR family transcriptional regulator
LSGPARLLVKSQSMPSPQISHARPLDSSSSFGGRASLKGERRQLSEEVASYVRELIISGEVRPGEFLRLEPIAEALGVSTTPVREGLLALRNEAFVRLIPRRGFVVEGFTRQDILDLFMVQADLAGELAARTAQRITAAQIADLESIDLAHRQAIAAGDREGIAYYGHAFHRAVNLAADSPRLANLLASVVRHLPNRFYTEIDGQIASMAHNHPRLLQAFGDHDGDGARRDMRRHILDAGEHLVASLEKRGIWTGEDPDLTESR